MLNFMYDMAQISTNLKPKSKSSVKTRSSSKVLLRVKRLRTNKFSRSMAYTGPKNWNNLTADFHNVTTKSKYKTMVSDCVTRKAIQRSSLLEKLECTQSFHFGTIEAN